MNVENVRYTRCDLLDELQDPTLFREFAYVNGEWVSGEQGKSIDVTNPADNSWLGRIPVLAEKQSKQAIDIAQQAFRQWSALLPQERSKLLRRWYDLMLTHKQDLAWIMTLEQGKPLSESLGEIDYAASFLEFYAEEAKRPNIESVTSHLSNAEVEVWREPLGIAGLITPWNFPSAMITRKAAAAMAAGCSVLVHPSYETPFSALALAELAHRAGIPAGVFNVLTGKPQTIVEPWMDSTQVRAISFTGSTEVGKLLYRQSADSVKHLILELGGHAPFLVFADADLERAVDCAISAKFATSGQDCLGANRFLVERPLYEKFCELFRERVAVLKVDAGHLDPDIGPLMNQSAIDKQIEHVEDAVSKGARLMLGGDMHAAGPLFYQPTVLADVPDDALIMQQETFGPVAAIKAFDTESEALEQANATEYGLIGYLHTENAKRIYHLTRELKFGMVAVNRTSVTGAPIPFGGMKQSGLGREGSRLGMEAFTDVKYVCRNFD